MFTALARAVVWIFESIMGLMVLAFIAFVAWVLVSGIMHAANN